MDSVLSTDNSRRLRSCLHKYVSNTTSCNKWALNGFESWRSRVAVEESFPDEVLSSDDLKLLRSCFCALWK